MPIRSRAKIAANSILHPMGIQLSAVDPYADRDWFYPAVSSCQIPTLPHLLEFFLGKRGDGTFVEVGAFDGISYSNTWGLAERGWDGFMAEPVPALAAKCRKNHEIHPKVHVIQAAVGSYQGSTSLLVAGEFTTANQAQAAEYRDTAWAHKKLTETSIEVPMTTLDNLLEENKVPANFDLLVVDVEGFEDAVFEGFTVSRWLPKMIIAELADTHPDLSVTAASDATLSAQVEADGYRIVYKDSINTVFVHQDVAAAAYEELSSE
jgi:FkbM family methyltransferase